MIGAGVAPLIAEPDGRVPAAADAPAMQRFVAAPGAIGQVVQVVDALGDASRVGVGTAALDQECLGGKLGDCVLFILVAVQLSTYAHMIVVVGGQSLVLRLRYKAGRVMSPLDLSHLGNDALDITIRVVVE